MAIEEEFSVEIPDAEADEITSVGQGEWTASFLGNRADIPAIDYIAKVCSRPRLRDPALTCFFLLADPRR